MGRLLATRHTDIAKPSPANQSRETSWRRTPRANAFEALREVLMNDKSPFRHPVAGAFSEPVT